MCAQVVPNQKKLSYFFHSSILHPHNFPIRTFSTVPAFLIPTVQTHAKSRDLCSVCLSSLFEDRLHV